MPVNQPQILVLIDGLPVPGATALDTESVAWFSADRFRIEFALGAAPQTSAAFFAALDAQTITINVALGGRGFVNLLTGQIDNVRLDLKENIASLCGRDLSAQLIDTEIAETFANQTASQIALTIAARHGLSANVTDTRTPVGQYYELDHARSALGAHARATTEWNLLTWLAQIENFSLSVVDTTLNFGPLPLPIPVFCTPQNFIALSLDTATTIPTTVTLKSWNTRNKMVNTQTAGSGAGIATTMIRPNLTQAQAQAIAANHLATLVQHTTILNGTMPGDLVLGPGAQIFLAGTESALDQLYTVEAVARSLDSRRGFTQTIRAYAVAA